MVWKVTASIRDDKSKRSSFTTYLPEDHFTTYALAEAWAAAMVLLLDPLLDGVITRVNISRDADIAGLRTTPEPDADVESRLKARYVLRAWDTVGGEKVNRGKSPFWHHLIATFSESRMRLAFDGLERYPDHLQPKVAAWKNIMAAAATMGHAANPCDARGLRIVTWGTGTKQVFSKSRK